MKLRLPFNGTFHITQRFGEYYTDSKGHTGIDYALPLGTPVLAMADGKVTFAGMDTTGYGNLIIIEHPDGSYSKYAHLSKFRVAKDMQVDSGTVIALSGGAKWDIGSGNSTGPHLHAEYVVNGKPVNPELYFGSGSVTPPADIDADGDGLVRVIVNIANIREEPNGKLIGTLNNGTIIALTGDRKTTNGLNWRKATVEFWIAEQDAFHTQMLGDDD